jgi:4-amino-4-deoxy-L-arabinose transferase-like glycosyltransferase
MKTAISTIPGVLIGSHARRHDTFAITVAHKSAEQPQLTLVDIVIPVYNEEHALPGCIAELDAYLSNYFSYAYRITVIDNGSSDTTWKVAKTLETLYPSVRAMHIAKKGRGRALKKAWSSSDADILAYMDVDLSTDLSALEPLITPLIRGEAALATGSRLQKRSRVVRSMRREFISRCYNRILRSSLHLRSGDAQCGFKAIRTDAAKKLLPQISDNDWFFDTELLAKAEREDLPVHEVAVTWQEDADSRVKIIQTSIDDLRGIHRLRKEFSCRTNRERWAIAAIVVSTFILYSIGASKNGYANSFYAAAVQAGTHSWKAFFYGSLDASNYITVDKPPVALWAMELSTRIFGFHAWSMLLPDVLAGVGTVYIVYAAVRRWFSATSALLGAAVMALTPIAVVMFGFNNPDAMLTLLLTSSTYTVIRALDSKHAVMWLSLAGVLIGIAFNTKMLQAFIPLPICVLIYLYAARPKLITRLKHILIAGFVLAISALWWPLIVSATPASNRPYIGSSGNNNIWSLIVGYNGVGRLLGESAGQGASPGGGNALPAGTGTRPRMATAPMAMMTGGTAPTGGSSRGGMAIRAAAGPGGSGFGESTGILRMFNSDFGPNIAWFIPVSLLAVVTVVWQRRRQPRIDKTRAAYLLWGGYLLLHIAVFSMVSGVIHPYYPVVMAPAIAALVGMGAPMLYENYRRKTNSAILLPVAVALTSLTACIILGYETSWLPWLRWVVLGGGLLAAAVLLWQLIQLMRSVKIALIVAALACSIAPTAYAISSVTTAHTGSIPTAGPNGTAMQGTNNSTASAEASFVSYLLSRKGSAKWLVAVGTASESAPIQITSGQPVMAVGGFNGSDDALTITKLAALVTDGELKYYAVQSGGLSGGTGGSQNSSILSWVEAHGTKVNYGGSGYTLYKLSD